MPSGRRPDPPLDIEIVENLGRVRLKNGGFCLIDASDAEFVGRWSWQWKTSRGGKVYVVRNRLKDDGPGARHIPLHRALLEPEANEIVDHEDGDGLNCRRGNMRLCNHSQNLKNRKVRCDSSTGLNGVCPSRSGRRFCAAIMSDGVRHRLGTFGTAAAAHAAYVEAAHRLHGEFANAG